MSIAFATNYDEEMTYEDGKQYADDKKLFVKFEVRAVKNIFESDKQGRPVYNDVEYIHIITPGSRDTLVTPLDDGYKRRFKERYDRWKSSGENKAVAEGQTVLTELPWLTVSQIEELRYFNIFTVEQLAEMSDTNAMQFMGNYKLRERAKNFLQAAAGEAPAMKLQQELEQRDNKIEVLQRSLDEMKAAFEKLSAEQNKRR